MTTPAMMDADPASSFPPAINIEDMIDGQKN